MFRIILAIFLVSSLNSYANSPNSQDILLWNSERGIKTFENSEYKQDFYQLVNFYQPQANPFYCGIASSVIVLNAFKNGKIESQKEFEGKIPQSLGGGVLEYKSYSQSNFLNAKTDKIKSKETIEFKKPTRVENGKEIYDEGLTLANLKDILTKVHKLKVKVNYATNNNEKSVAEFRKNLKKYLQDDTHFVLANFDGRVIKTNGAGHISPLVAYDESSDSVMVLDVAAHKRLWYFVSVTKLYEAMNTKDGASFRGYLIVSQ